MLVHKYSSSNKNVVMIPIIRTKRGGAQMDRVPEKHSNGNLYLSVALVAFKLTPGKKKQQIVYKTNEIAFWGENCNVKREKKNMLTQKWKYDLASSLFYP